MADNTTETPGPQVMSSTDTSNPKDVNYFLYQTPVQFAKDILSTYDNLFAEGDVLYEPFRGEGAFYSNFPARCRHLWSERVEGKDFDTETDYDWVITNPPFRTTFKDKDGKLSDKKKNAFWLLLEHFSKQAKKGVVFVGNDKCISALTPKRLTELSQRGWGLTHISTANVKKWRGRYMVLVFQRTATPILNFFETTY